MNHAISGLFLLGRELTDIFFLFYGFNNDRRLSDVLNLLSSRQPKCAQLYIYSSADRVIPAESVESFVEDQRRAGHEVRACNFVSTPHVDHFRGDPNLYTSELTRFLEEDCVLACCTNSSRVTHTTNQ